MRRRQLRIQGLVAGMAAVFAAWAAVAEPIEVTARPVPLNPNDPAEVRVGQLRYMGGLELTSPSAEFGGLSALGVSVDGRRIIALTDRGRRLAAYLVHDAAGVLTSLHRPELDTLAGLDGQPLKAKSLSDAESLSPGVEGEIIVGFERRHRLWRYLPGQVRPEPLPAPAELDGLPSNSGLEALALLADGRLLAISEGPEDSPAALAWVSDTDGWSVMTYATDGGFRPTGAATLPGGDVLVLERRFTLRTGVAARIRRLPAGQVTAGAHLVAEPVAELRPPLNVDNFEGIAVRPGPDGRTWIYIVSDDNFNPLQRTLLLMLELPD